MMEPRNERQNRNVFRMQRSSTDASTIGRHVTDAARAENIGGHMKILLDRTRAFDTLTLSNSCRALTRSVPPAIAEKISATDSKRVVHDGRGQ